MTAHQGKVKRSTVPTKAELLADRERHSKAMLDLVALVKRLLERINHFSHVAAQDYAREAERTQPTKSGRSRDERAE